MSDEVVETAGWRLDIEEDTLRAEHLDTGNEYVFDAEGSLTLPGDPEIEMAALQRALVSGLGDDTATEDTTADDATTEDAAGEYQETGHPAVDDGVDDQTPADATDDDGSVSEVERQSAGCRIECDEQTDEVLIESPTKISLEAPEVEVSGGNQINLVSNGGLNLRAATMMNLRASIINLN